MLRIALMDSPPSSIVSANTVVQDRLWLPNLAPQATLGLGGAFALACIIGATLLATRQLSLGITWEAVAGKPGLVVAAVSDKTKLMPLTTGDRMLAIRLPGEAPIALENELILEDPDIHPIYAGYNRFFEQQALVATALRQSSIELIRADGQKMTVNPRERRPLAELPWVFWVYNLGGAGSFLISLGVWSYRRGNPSTRLFVLAGLGFFGGVLCLSVYGTRELALNADLFRAMTATNHFFMLLMTYSLLALFGYFPQRLVNAQMIVALYAVMALIWLNETLQWYQVPIHTFYVLTFLVPYAFALPLAWMQWRRSNYRPLERAALQWFLLAILISLGAAIAVFVIPPLYEVYLDFSFPIATLIVLIMFIGLALGILRYRLFNLDRWWFFAWAGFLSVVLVIGLDVALIHFFSLTPPVALAFSLLAVGWIYFPVRQWLWSKLIEPPERHLEHYLPRLIDALFSSASTDAFLEAWHDLLQDIFQPLNIKPLSGACSAVTVHQNGLVLQSPSPIGVESFELIGNRRGTRLFGPHDVNLVEAILVIAKRFIRLRQAQEKTATAERERIMRALHDDVSPKLLTLLHRAHSETDTSLAQSALDSLKEAIYTLKHRHDTPLAEALGDWRAEINERIENLPIRLHWSQPEKADQILLAPWQYVHCQSILREAVSNILKHSQASEMTIGFLLANQRLHMTVTDNGCATDSSAAWYMKTNGQGLANMRKRAAELGGTIQWLSKDTTTADGTTGLTVKLSFPLR